jgi:phosphoglucomutase
MLIAQMAAWHKSQGRTLVDALESVYNKYGYYLDHLDSFVLKGKEGVERIKQIMELFRENGLSILSADRVTDFSLGVNGLPCSDVLKFQFSNGSWVAIRPSGTEPKIKIYYSVKAEQEKDAQATLENLRQLFSPYFKV